MGGRKSYLAKKALKREENEGSEVFYPKTPNVHVQKITSVKIGFNQSKIGRKKSQHQKRTLVEKHRFTFYKSQKKITT